MMKLSMVIVLVAGVSAGCVGTVEDAADPEETEAAARCIAVGPPPHGAIDSERLRVAVTLGPAVVAAR